MRHVETHVQAQSQLCFPPFASHDGKKNWFFLCFEPQDLSFVVKARFFVAIEFVFRILKKQRRYKAKAAFCWVKINKGMVVVGRKRKETFA